MYELVAVPIYPDDENYFIEKNGKTIASQTTLDIEELEELVKRGNNYEPMKEMLEKLVRDNLWLEHKAYNDCQLEDLELMAIGDIRRRIDEAKQLLSTLER